MSRFALRIPLLLTCVLVGLAACGGGGGGGGSSNPPPAPQPAAQTIAFATAGPIAKVVGDAAFANTASGGAGTGAITYTSSNTAVATVGVDTGAVTVIAAGTTVITAMKAASAGFLAATATYTLNVADPPPAAQTIAFATPGMFNRTLGDPPFTNVASGGAGTGAITYSSTDVTVATVNATTGEVTLVAPGTTTINAFKAASIGFLAAGASYTVNVAAPPTPPVAQVIAFAQPGPLTRAVGDAPFFNVASGGGGTGAISYSSSNTAVATVTPATGQVVVIATGTATITATKAASPGYLAAAASFTLTVTPGPAAQAISFADGGPVARTFAIPPPTFTNVASGGAGTGAITYSSNDTSVATVNATTGAVTVVGAGTAIIVALKAASPGYASAAAAYTVNVARGTETLSFLYPGPLSKRPYDHPVLNPIYNAYGTGSTTYSSSDTSVVLVDEDTGLLTFMTTGTATITATKAQDANWLAATGTLVVNVHNFPRRPFHAWIGANDTLAEFPALAVGADFMRSGLGGCSFNNFESCPFASVATFGATSRVDASTRTFNTGVYALRRNGIVARPMVVDGYGYPATSDNEIVEVNGTLWSFDFAQGFIDRSNDGRAWTPSSPPMPYGTREGAAAVAFKNSIYVIGGNQLTIAQTSEPGATVGEKGDVYALDTRGGSGFETHNAAFGARKFHRAVSFNGRMWVIGGQRGTPAQYLNDIWSSANGRTWTQVTAAAPFSPRAEHAVTVFAGRLWLVGGRNATTRFKDVWSSIDGVNWVFESEVGNFGRAGHRIVAHNGRLYVLGVAEFLDYYAYSSTDGVTWDFHDTIQAPYLTRFAAIEFRNKLWIMGGTNDVNGCCARGDVWSSGDAFTWVYESLGAPFSSMPGARMAVFNNELYLTASSSWERTHENAVHRTSDVIDWVKADTSPIISQMFARSETAFLPFNGRLYFLGGRSLEYSTFHTVWGDVVSTADGSAWTRNNSNAFLPRYGHSGYVIGGRMFVLGGYNDLGQQLGDIHSTANGSAWQVDVPVSTNIGLRSYHETVVFNGRVWLLGGEKNGTGVTGEIWSSADGVTWVLEKAFEPATVRKQFGAAVWNGRIWIVGGVNAGGTVLADVWSSADGENWQQETASAFPIPRARMALAAFNNRLYLFGGEARAPRLDAGRGINEMWMSEDGVVWRELYRNEMEVP